MKNKKKFSQDYYSLIKEYKFAHKNGIQKNNFFLSNNITFDGKSLEPWIKNIKKIISNTDSKSILDYGCGKAKFYNNRIQIDNLEYNGLSDYWEIEETKLFDPGIEEYESYPVKKYDGVICTDVLEHIYKKDLDSVVEDIFNFSKKFVFFVISTSLDKKILSSGRNVHQTVKNEEWWKKFFLEAKYNFSKISCYVILTNLGDNSDQTKRII